MALSGDRGVVGVTSVGCEKENKVSDMVSEMRRGIWWRFVWASEHFCGLLVCIGHDLLCHNPT